MAIGIDELWDDPVENQPSELVDQDIEYSSEPLNNQQQNQEDTLMSDYLKTLGIDDMSKIKFQDDDNNIVERDWNDLSNEEKLGILGTHYQPTVVQQQDNDLTDDEVTLLNQIRQSNLTPSEFIQQLIVPQESEPTYKVDDLSDDEIYLLDLESRVGELTDEQAAEALNLVKLNEDLYLKLIEGIRKEYKEREDFQSQQILAQQQEEQQQAFQEYLAKVVDAIDSFNAIGNLDLNFEDLDKEELAQFMLLQDDSGKNYLQQALEDPETLVKAAWFILNGDEAFSEVSDYFINLIKLVSENLYKKGFEDGKKGISTRPKVVIGDRNQTIKEYKTVEDLFD